MITSTVKNLKVLAVPFLFLVLPFFVFSQIQSDTLVRAKQFFDMGKYQNANKLLGKLSKKYPDDLNVNWLYAQSAYWSKKFNRSMLLYEDAIARHPENLYLLLDYGVKLVDIGEFEKASFQLEKYLAYDSLGSEALVALSKMAFWQGHYKTAILEIDKVLSLQPGNVKAQELRKEILLTKSPWFHLSVGAVKDDQPLFSLRPSLEVGFSQSAFINPLISIVAPRFIADETGHQTFDLRLGNKMNITKYAATIFIEGGIFKLPTDEKSFTGALKLSKKFFRQFNLELGAEHKPYLSTKSNMTYPLNRLHYDFSLNWSGKKGWMGRLGYDINDFYGENNKIHSSGFWLVSPSLKIARTETRLGYAYSYSTSDEDRFTPAKSLTEILGSWVTTRQITGYYMPYFTPKDQSVHSAIFLIGYKPVRNFETGLKITYGFRGTTQNPYFFLNRKDNNEIFIQKAFYEDTFKPYDGKIYIDWRLSRKITLKTEYALMSTYFYKSHSGLVSLLVRLHDEKKAN